MWKKENGDGSPGNHQEIIAFLGKGTEFKGIITYDGVVRIDGRVEGKVISQGTLVVGESAILDAEIDAGTVVSGGTINGNIIATHKVHLLPSAVQTGYIRAPILIIEEGASFNGNCEMGKVGEPLEAAVKFRES